MGVRGGFQEGDRGVGVLTCFRLPAASLRAHLPCLCAHPSQNPGWSGPGNPATQQPGGDRQRGEGEKGGQAAQKGEVGAAGQADALGRPDWESW